MWIFGYGSLMWDGWEREYGAERSERAALQSYHRAFNKASWENWGTREIPGPTLGLEPKQGDTCIGTAFLISHEKSSEALRKLTKREGKSFTFNEEEIVLADGRRVGALVPINDRTRPTYIGKLEPSKLADLAKKANGNSGKCSDYVKNTREMLKSLGITDPHVEAFHAIVNPDL